MRIDNVKVSLLQGNQVQVLDDRANLLNPGPCERLWSILERDINQRLFLCQLNLIALSRVSRNGNNFRFRVEMRVREGLKRACSQITLDSDASDREFRFGEGTSNKGGMVGKKFDSFTSSKCVFIGLLPLIYNLYPNGRIYSSGTDFRFFQPVKKYQLFELHREVCSHSTYNLKSLKIIKLIEE